MEHDGKPTLSLVYYVMEQGWEIWGDNSNFQLLAAASPSLPFIHFRKLKFLPQAQVINLYKVFYKFVRRLCVLFYPLILPRS